MDRSTNAASFRATSEDTAELKGTATATQLLVIVNLYWLILPLIATSSTFILLVVTIVQSNIRGVPVWKSNQLECMTLLEPEVEESMRQDREKTVETEVALAKDTNGFWRLRKEKAEAADDDDDRSII